MSTGCPARLKRAYGTKQDANGRSPTGTFINACDGAHPDHHRKTEPVVPAGSCPGWIAVGIRVALEAAAAWLTLGRQSGTPREANLDTYFDRKGQSGTRVAGTCCGELAMRV